MKQKDLLDRIRKVLRNALGDHGTKFPIHPDNVCRVYLNKKRFVLGELNLEYRNLQAQLKLREVERKQFPPPKGAGNSTHGQKTSEG